MPKVSVIVPNYNHAIFLNQRIDSILDQNYKDFELILLDDCSSDNSRKILNSYSYHPKVKHIVYNEKNSGSTFKQWVKGLKLAQGEFIWIAESDDTSDCNFLTELLPVLEKNKEVGLAYSQSSRMDSDGNIKGTWKSFTDEIDAKMFESDFILDGKEYIDKCLLIKNTIPNASAVVFRKSVLEQTGLPDEDIKYCSDWLFWLKIASNYSIYYNYKSLNNFRFHQNSVIATADNTHHFYNLKMLLRYKQYLLTIRNNELLSRVNQMLSSVYFEIGLRAFKSNEILNGWKYAFFLSIRFCRSLLGITNRFNFCIVESFRKK